MTQSLTILGSTGSIGSSTLDVVARHPERFRIFALSGHRQTAKLAEQCLAFRPQYAVTADAAQASELRARLAAAGCATEVLHGPQALIDIAAAPETDGVMAAIVGAAGLPPTLAAAQAGKTIYLANKETLVVSGSLFMQTAARAGARILPVDSEHNAIYQVLPKEKGYLKPSEASFREAQSNGVESIILTASGGPFLHTDLADFPAITPAQAVKHPNWQMGRKISVDSATMMNKGLELIEAHWLFNCPPEKLETVIHPQSVVHSMVRYADGSVLAQLGTPDMRTPIAYCLGLPERIASGAAPLDFTTLSALTFEAPDYRRFPCLELAYQAMQAGGGVPCVLNAANEIAVAAFLDGRIRFTDIARVVRHTLEQEISGSHQSLEGLLDWDAAARRIAVDYVSRLE